jgi:hypothetical protein
MIKEARAKKSKLRPLNAFMAFRCKFLQSWEKRYSADSINSILLITAPGLEAEDEVRDRQYPLGTGSLEALLGHRFRSVVRERLIDVEKGTLWSLEFG